MWEDAKTTSVKDGPEIPVNVAVMCEVIKKCIDISRKSRESKIPKRGVLIWQNQNNFYNFWRERRSWRWRWWNSVDDKDIDDRAEEIMNVDKMY